MTNAQALKAYRKLKMELTALEGQLNQLLHTGRPRGVITQRYDALPGTNDAESAAMQLADGLEAIAEAKQRELDALQAQVDAIIAQIMDYKMLVIIRRYYLAGDTDEMIAELLHMSDRYICRVRNDFLRNLDSHRARIVYDCAQ